MAEKPLKLTPDNIARLAEQLFSDSVVKLSAPGGKSRESLRVHFETRTVVATQRSKSGRMRMEVEVLKRLTAEGAPVPRYLVGGAGIFFQEDMGARRLSGEMLHTSGDAQIDVASRAVASLVEIRAAGKRARLADIVPALGDKKEWVAGFVASPTTVAQDFGFLSPELAMDKVVDRLNVVADTFIKWDARPGNASIGKDTKVYWFDWEHCGKRHGVEDLAWLAGDEFWPVGAKDMAALFHRHLPVETRDEEIAYLGVYLTFHTVQRLRLILRRHAKKGWIDPLKAMKYDRIGVDRDLALRLCGHGRDWAERDALTRPMKAWFDACADKVETLA